MFRLQISQGQKVLNAIRGSSWHFRSILLTEIFQKWWKRARYHHSFMEYIFDDMIANLRGLDLAES